MGEKKQPAKRVSANEKTDGANAAGRRPTSAAPEDGPLSYIVPDTAPGWLAALAEVAEVGAYKRLSYDLLAARPGMRVLDVGCGVGDDARAIAKLVGAGGEVVGVDASPEMIAAASAATDAAPVRFLVARGEHLPFDDESFDAVRVDRMLQHVEAPALVLREIARVLRPGGRAVFVEPDWKTMAVYPGSPVGGDDDSTVAAIFRWQMADTRHPLIGRQLQSLLTEGGFDRILVHPVAYRSPSFEVANLALELTSVIRRAEHDGAPLFPTEEGRAWVAAARDAESAGRFFASMCLFFARGFKAPREG